jgi:hypothetical protein
MAIPLPSCSIPFWMAAPFQLNTLATNSRPFHTNLLVFSSPPDYQPRPLLITSRHGPRRKHRSSVACVSVAAGTWLPSRSIVAAVYSCLLRLCCLATDVVPMSLWLLMPRNECFRAVRWQRLFLWLHSPYFEQICHKTYDRAGWHSSGLIPEVLGWNPGLKTGYPDWGFRDFLSPSRQVLD